MITKMTQDTHNKIHIHSIGVEALERAPKAMRFSRSIVSKPIIDTKEMATKKESDTMHTQSKSSNKENSLTPSLKQFQVYTPHKAQSPFIISITRYVLRPNVAIFKHFHGYAWFNIGFDDSEMAMVKAPHQSPQSMHLSIKNHSCYNGITSANLIRHIRAHVPKRYRASARHFEAKVVRPNYIVFDLAKPFLN